MVLAGFIEFIGSLFLLIILVKFAIWLCGYLISSYGRKIGCGVKWTADNGEYVVVAGACGHIGAEYAREFASMGYNLVLIGRDAEKIQRLAESFQAKNYAVSDIQIIEVDFAQPDFIDAVREAMKDVQPIVGLINAIGISYSAKKFTDLGTQKVKDMMMVNIVAPTLLIDFLLPQMDQQQRGVIINLGSQISKLKLPFYSMFGASKAYMHTLSEAISLEYYKRGVTIQNVCPLFLKSTMAAELKPHGSFQISSAMSVFSAMQTVGIESTTYGHISHRFTAMLIDTAIFIFGTKIVTQFCERLMPYYVDFTGELEKKRKKRKARKEREERDDKSSSTIDQKSTEKVSITESANVFPSEVKKTPSNSSLGESRIEHIAVAIPGTEVQKLDSKKLN